MSAQVWNVGCFAISQIIEVEIGDVIQEVIPEATPANIVKIEWLFPYYADKNGALRAVVQSFLVQGQGIIMLVDTCVGNSKRRVDIPALNMLRTNFIDRLRSVGVQPSDVTHVLCTHLHFDHVGWNTTLENGRWVPTFPNASYLFSKDEYNYWVENPDAEIADDRNGFTDSVLPIVEAGLALFVDHEYQPAPGISLIPTPGHTPDHVSVQIESEGSAAVITGDAMHHPCQVAQPAWGTLSDYDRDQAQRSRVALLSRCVDSNALVLGSHFAPPSGGHLLRAAPGFYFAPVNNTTL